jgi:hypothetical protein
MHMDLTIAIYVICVILFLAAVCTYGTITHPGEIKED